MSAVETGERPRSSRISPLVEANETKPSYSQNSEPAASSSKYWIACGIFFAVLGVYVLTSPGRIDIVDGQARFNVAYNWIVNGRPVMDDPWLKPFMGVPGRDGHSYSYYGAAGSVVAIPLVWTSLHFNPSSIPSSQFLFSLTSSMFGAGIALILFLFYLELGITRRKALTWTIISSFATYVWPISTSTFDNAQHAFFVIAAVYFGFLSAKRKSTAHAALGGLLAGMLILYQEYLLLIIPALALCTIASRSADDSAKVSRPSESKSIFLEAVWVVRRSLSDRLALVRSAWNENGEARSSCARYLAFCGAASIGLILTLAYKDLRFGSWLYDEKIRAATQRGYSVFGNPVAGFLSLLVSPGKSIFLYNPPLVFGIIGFRELRRRVPELSNAIAAATVLLVAFISCIRFAGGDWCWGPRYLTPLLPLFALAFPFAAWVKLRRETMVAIVAVGFLVQVLGLSVENQRFFFAKGLNDFFWGEDSWFYFKHSALFDRVGEAASLNQALPATAQWFSPTPVPEWTTYSILGPPPPRRLAPVWMRYFKIFFLPRPWPLWISWLPPSLRPVNLGYWLLGVFSMTALGVGSIYRGCRLEEFA